MHVVVDDNRRRVADNRRRMYLLLEFALSALDEGDPRPPVRRRVDGRRAPVSGAVGRVDVHEPAALALQTARQAEASPLAAVPTPHRRRRVDVRVVQNGAAEIHLFRRGAGRQVECAAADARRREDEQDEIYEHTSC